MTDPLARASGLEDSTSSPRVVACKDCKHFDGDYDCIHPFCGVERTDSAPIRGDVTRLCRKIIGHDEGLEEWDKGDRREGFYYPARFLTCRTLNENNDCRFFERPLIKLRWFQRVRMWWLRNTEGGMV